MRDRQSFVQSGQGRLGGWYLFSLIIIISSNDTQGKPLFERPKIISPTNSTVIAEEDTNCTLTCIARSTWPDFHMVYWLANNNFIEDVYPNGRVTEGPERQIANQTVEKSLVFSTTHKEDFSVQFTCVIQDPSGVDVKNVILQTPAERICNQTNRERHLGG
ncbi:interleukin-18-binding protein [Rhinophrynus dorsalis]